MTTIEIEEAAERHAFIFYEREDREVGKQAFIAGVEWQAEQFFKDGAIKTLEKGLELLVNKVEKMYSDEEVLDLLAGFSDFANTKEYVTYKSITDWFGQNKKK